MRVVITERRGLVWNCLLLDGYRIGAPLINNCVPSTYIHCCSGFMTVGLYGGLYCVIHHDAGISENYPREADLTARRKETVLIAICLVPHRQKKMPLVTKCNLSML